MGVCGMSFATPLRGSSGRLCIVETDWNLILRGKPSGLRHEGCAANPESAK